MKRILAFSLCAALPLAMPLAHGQTSSSSPASPSSPASSAPAAMPDGGTDTGSGNRSGSGAASGGPDSSSGNTFGTDAAKGQSGGATGTSPRGGSSDAGTMGPAGAGASGANSPATQAINGKSVKSDMMGESVYNENNDKVGSVKDVVLGGDGKVTEVVIGAGGFLGMGEHDVAVPFDKVTRSGDKLILQGYTKEQLKALPRAKVAQ
ncbi:PRC-barrel domain-containing protein [Castellaniella ginsengisoli]|uniref:PRC-barrel domain-containing protein n=1 Tax=Castellaniella ginsengisoli TaxID=546114 RepID=A0AB39CXX8_9BURK